MKLLLYVALFLSGLALARAEDWKTIDGKQYPDVTVQKVEPDAVTILYRDGGALIPLAILPDDLQKRFHYDPAAARAAADARDQADFENARLLRAEAAQIEQQKLADHEAVPANSDDSYTDNSVSTSTHHTMGELVSSMSSLRADYSPGSNHYTAAACVPPGPISGPSSDPNHHSIGSLFPGDPLSPGANN